MNVNKDVKEWGIKFRQQRKMHFFLLFESIHIHHRFWKTVTKKIGNYQIYYLAQRVESLVTETVDDIFTEMKSVNGRLEITTFYDHSRTVSNS